ncbi:MAG TPA: hypothetical protein VLB11_08075 [Methyloceanibacter sp.]|nr:hypothetical protein [Methyloceanibacter sp.]
MLRFIAVALVAASSVVSFGTIGFAEPLEKDACAKLEVERKKLLTSKMQSALEQGPDWVKNHLNEADIEKVREFLLVEEKLKFRCRESVVARAMQRALNNPDSVTLPDRKPALPASAAAASVPSTPAAGGTVDPEMPLPNRNPAAAQRTIADANPSQTVAGSDKTAPSDAKATR